MQMFPGRRLEGQAPPLSLPHVILGGVYVGLGTAAAVGRRTRAVAGPVVKLALRPPVLTARWQPATVLSGVSRSGSRHAAELVETLSSMLDVLVPLVVDELVRRVDLNRLVEENLDLADVVQQALDAIDLPEVIRESTASVASETLRGVRLQGISGDDAVGRAIDRLRRGRVHARPSAGPVPATVAPALSGTETGSGTGPPPGTGSR